MKRMHPRGLFRPIPLLLSLLCALPIANAQPADDPGLGEAPPPKPAPPPPPPATPPPSEIHTAPPPYIPPPAAPEVKETRDTKVTWLSGGASAVDAEGDLYERAAAPTMQG